MVARRHLSVDVDEDQYRVLHVDDEPGFASQAAAHLERQADRLDVCPETDAAAALERVEAESFDCIVSDYNMPGLNGIELLREVRDIDDDLPFILFTGRGSEEIASEAISAGVTEYLQKEVGTDQYTVLANRIQNTIEQYRAVKEIEETQQFYEQILSRSWDYVIIVDENGMIDYVSPAVERTMGYDPNELIGTNSFEFPHPDDRQKAFEALSKVIESADKEVTVEYRTQHADGSWKWIEVRGGNLLDNPVIGGIMVNVRDVTERKRHERNLQRQSNRLQELTRYLSHDMKNQLAIVDGHLELVSMSIEDENLEIATNAIDRMEEMIENIRQLAESGPGQLEPTTTALDGVVRRSWANVHQPGTTMDNRVDMDIVADAERLQQLLENLFHNAIEHGGPDVTVDVDEVEVDSAYGFRVRNDGASLPVDEPARIFESGFTTSDGGTGLGLAIVKQVVESHGWSIDVNEPEDGGVEFVITGIEPAD